MARPIKDGSRRVLGVNLAMYAFHVVATIKGADHIRPVLSRPSLCSTTPEPLCLVGVRGNEELRGSICTRFNSLAVRMRGVNMRSLTSHHLRNQPAEHICKVGYWLADELKSLSRVERRGFERINQCAVLTSTDDRLASLTRYPSRSFGKCYLLKEKWNEQKQGTKHCIIALKEGVPSRRPPTLTNPVFRNVNKRMPKNKRPPLLSLSSSSPPLFFMFLGFNMYIARALPTSLLS
ncbi:hypothetical protein TSMEX_001831 [Taenia solium]|eukprot:TsM_001047100 transcript=TsM_001047100 gene=TsM_001047100